MLQNMKDLKSKIWADTWAGLELIEELCQTSV